MDWTACIKTKMVKDIHPDKNKLISLRKIAEKKKEGAEMLPFEYYYAKITLLYDALRMLLECKALEKGYKIYNHECYTSFLKEILQLSQEANIFDNLRKIRNGINYYGREITKEEAEHILNNITELFHKFNKEV